MENTSNQVIKELNLLYLQNEVARELNETKQWQQVRLAATQTLIAKINKEGNVADAIEALKLIPGHGDDTQKLKHWEELITRIEKLQAKYEKQ